MRALMLTLLGLAAAATLEAQVAVRGETVHTMAGDAIRDGLVLIGRDGRIEQVGPAKSIRVPAGYRTMTAKVVTPGLVDAHTVVGLAGALNQPHDQDQLETSDPLQPELRAVDAYNAREVLVEWLRSFGVTTLHTGHGPGALMSGQTMVVKTVGNSVAEAVVDSSTMIAMTLGPDVRRAALITANSVSEILAALRLQAEFGFRLVLDGASEAYLVLPQIKAAGVPVILHPSMARQTGGTENATLEDAMLLRNAGMPVALQSGFEGYVPKTRVVLFEAAILAANGLTPAEALATITIDAARIIGQGSRIGSLEVGKDGDMVLFDGDPFEYTSHVCGVLISGRVVRESCR